MRSRRTCRCSSGSSATRPALARGDIGGAGPGRARGDRGEDPRGARRRARDRAARAPEPRVTRWVTRSRRTAATRAGCTARPLPSGRWSRCGRPRALGWTPPALVERAPRSSRRSGLPTQVDRGGAGGVVAFRRERQEALAGRGAAAGRHRGRAIARRRSCRRSRRRPPRLTVSGARIGAAPIAPDRRHVFGSLGAAAVRFVWCDGCAVRVCGWHRLGGCR